MHLDELDCLVEGKQVEDVASQKVVVLIVCHDVALQLRVKGKCRSHTLDMVQGR